MVLSLFCRAACPRPTP